MALRFEMIQDRLPWRLGLQKPPLLNQYTGLGHFEGLELWIGIRAIKRSDLDCFAEKRFGLAQVACCNCNLCP
jgi:hypothetical protein